MTRALIAVDIQNDFCEGGALAVPGGGDVARRTAEHVARAADDYGLLVATRDWHTARTVGHFAPDGETPDFRTTWPRHCVAGTTGADYHPEFAGTVVAHPFLEIIKGQEHAAFSGFEGHLLTDSRTGLADLLDEHGVTEVHVAGIAADYCVKATVMDALAWQRIRGLAPNVVLLADLTVPVDADTGAAAVDAMRAAGATIAVTARR